MRPLKTLTAERTFVTVSKVISQRDLKCLSLANTALTTFENQALRELVLTLDSYVWGIAKERVTIHERWPSNWWQALRERWFPAWWLRRWPVLYHKIDVDRQIFGPVCPHLNIPTQQRHLEWMTLGDTEAK